MILILMLSFLQEPKDMSQIMPFMKVESVGISPYDNTEKILYRKSVGDRLVKEFKSTPVYLVKYEKQGDKTVSKFVQVGTASCVFFTENNWLSASMNIKSEIPEGYVLRAHTVAKKNDIMPYKTLEVQEASIIQFYLKPKDMSVIFK